MRITHYDQGCVQLELQRGGRNTQGQWVPTESHFVDPQYFRNGAGSALINKAKESNTHLKLLVDFKNTDAILFYESQGFIQSGAIENADAFEYQWSP